MLKLKSPITKLSSAIALALFAGASSADTIYSTKHYLLDQNDAYTNVANGYDTIQKGDWFAGYFYVPNAQSDPAKPQSLCQNGCDITGATLYLIGGRNDDPLEPSSLAGVTLEVFSNSTSENTWGKYPGAPLFTLNTPEEVKFDGTQGGPGTLISFTADPQDQSAPALLQPGTGYWLKLTSERVSEFGWYYNGLNKPGEYWAGVFGSGHGSPYIFEVTGTNSLTPRLAPSLVPIPGAAWMMGSALIGLLSIGRRKRPN
ncbi:MAG: VPLPA-CTERM sorting domain-containing protein [Methylicorpusculum sp.]|uniref:VPLPA-CTERM sorting domain-containing protein n=1 Tax=Methylicorpusculum sp. TaxID=2713644 RepID=UPI002727D7F1|nr:VPLPA-CTERM sorting domain-containing protein [Methylicorpusculum sp.]MDO8845406.1 VPLPA-CTERM sorting domain-containing protein [Methylicorpusculum sp.]MDO8940064.1 VPLPA-CTERM sorting domain-containing protein [Methylicorpusculum sp.]MDP2201445.1 VPLPA-CTERM sorting domain-containing protein [Methylicorpusculum sp.]